MPGALRGVMAWEPARSQSNHVSRSLRPHCTQPGGRREVEGSLLHLGIMSLKKAKPQGPLAHGDEMKKRITRQLNCCAPRLPWPMVTILQVPPPAPHSTSNRKQDTVSPLKVNLNGTIDSVGSLKEPGI